MAKKAEAKKTLAKRKLSAGKISSAIGAASQSSKLEGQSSKLEGQSSKLEECADNGLGNRSTRSKNSTSVDSAISLGFKNSRTVRLAGSSKTSSPRKKKSATKTAGVSQRNWRQMSDETLLDMRMCDLQLDLQQSPLMPKIDRLYEELAGRELIFRPHFWLSDEWFAPDGIPGIAIPFYLAHRRLARLERKMMLDVEGGTEEWCMKILRHETGHALDTAFRLHRKKKYREIFGNYSDPYPEYYRPHPKSRRYVMHLEPWYAQSHPAEDFAETFAVWLKPGSRWRSQYKGWPALRKLEYIDELMDSIAGTKAPVASRRKIEPLSHLKRTLREHYQQRRARYEMDMPTPFDRDLYRLFLRDDDHQGITQRQQAADPAMGELIQQQASAFLRKYKSETERQVTSWTGENRYTVSLVIREVIDRCRELRLRAVGSETELLRDITIFITVQTMNYLHSGLHRVAL